LPHIPFNVSPSPAGPQKNTPHSVSGCLSATDSNTLSHWSLAIIIADDEAGRAGGRDDSGPGRAEGGMKGTYIRATEMSW